MKESMGRIRILVDMLEEHINMLEDYNVKNEEWNKERDKARELGERFSYYENPYPQQRTSEKHIRDIAKIIRKELLNI